MHLDALAPWASEMRPDGVCETLNKRHERANETGPGD